MPVVRVREEFRGSACHERTDKLTVGKEPFVDFAVPDRGGPNHSRDDLGDI